jgi:flagellar basal-body rod protein FlgB
MDLGKTALFEMMKGRFAWLSQRQQVLARNIANADTPGYRPRDLEPFGFGDMVRSQAGHLDMEMTSPVHLGGQRRPEHAFSERQNRRPFETAPAGNAVILEEQMAKVNETSVAHKLTTELYRKHLGMIRMALGRR